MKTINKEGADVNFAAFEEAIVQEIARAFEIPPEIIQRVNHRKAKALQRETIDTYNKQRKTGQYLVDRPLSLDEALAQIKREIESG